MPLQRVIRTETGSSPGCKGDPPDDLATGQGGGCVRGRACPVADRTGAVKEAARREDGLRSLVRQSRRGTPAPPDRGLRPAGRGGPRSGRRDLAAVHRVRGAAPGTAYRRPGRTAPGRRAVAAPRYRPRRRVRAGRTVLCG